MRQVVRDPQVAGRELTLFFALTLTVSIAYVLLSGPYIAPGAGSEAATVWYREKALVIIWAPMAFALLMALLFRGRAGLWLILRRFDPRGVGARWWLVALVLPVVIHAGPVYLSGGFERTATDFLLAWAGALLMLVSIMIGEELGWRGYALPALQARFTPFTATLVLGGLWAAWHYPVWFGIGYGQTGEVGTAVAVVLINTLGITAMAFVLTWLANSTSACIPAVMLYHGTNNASLRLYGEADGTVPFLVSTVMVLLVAVLVVVANRKRFFGRESPPD